MKDTRKDINIKRKKFNIRRLFILIAFILIVIYILYTIFLLIKEPTDKQIVSNGTIYSEETDIGYIIRDEKVVKGNNYKNGIEQILTEGEKAAKDQDIFRYYNKNEEELNKKISELDKKIEETLGGQISPYSPDIKIIENQLDEKIEKLNNTKNISELLEYKKEISKLISKKAQIIGENSKAGSYLKDLYNQRANLENELNSGAEYIKAPSSGVVSYKIDGLEETLTPNNFSSINKQFLENLNLKTGQLIATSNECGKIINNFVCYIATISNSNEAKNAKVEDKISVRLSNDKVIDAEVAYISNEDNENTLLILKIANQIEELASYRKITFDIIWWSYTGFKVANSAVVEQNNINYVVENIAGYLYKIPVKIKRKTEKYSIIENLSSEELTALGFSQKEINNMRKLNLYDEILVTPDINKAN